MSNYSSRPPGPRQLPLLGSALQMRADVRGFADSMHKQFGDQVAFHFLSQPASQFTHPADVQEILQRQHMAFNKDVIIIRAMRVLLGEGIFTSNGSFWLRQRRLMQPAFSHQHLGFFLSLMIDATQEMLARWHEQDDQPLDIQAEMLDLSLDIILRALIGANIDAREQVLFRKRVTALLPLIANYIKLPIPPISIPTPRNTRLRRAIEELDAFLLPFIEERGEQAAREDNLLSLLLVARDEETGVGMPARQVRDEMMTLLLGGYETTGETLGWVFYFLSQNPEFEARVRAEIARILDGRVPTLQDLKDLRYTEAVVNEVLRLNPPAVALVRQCIKEGVAIGGYSVPKGSLIFLFPHITQRHPDYWREPTEVFDPERFLQDVRVERGAYFPFGGGPRVCIGEGFARMELLVVVALVLQVYRLQLARDARVSSEALVSVRLDHLPMTLSRM